MQGDEKTFNSETTVRVNYKLEQFEPFNLKSLTVKLDGVDTFKVKYFFLGEDTPVLTVSSLTWKPCRNHSLLLDGIQHVHIIYKFSHLNLIILEL